MAFEGHVPQTLIAGAAVARNRLVKISSGLAIQGAAATDECVGVSVETAAASGDTIAVAPLNFSKVEIESGAAISIGALITSDSVGRAVTASTGNAISGQALAAASAAGQFITVLVFKGSLAAA